MFTQTLHSKAKSVLKKLNQIKDIEELYLAGGTALALQLGHRVSVDLDFFSQDILNTQALKATLSQAGLKYTISNESPGTLDLIMENVKTSFLEYRYPVLHEFSNYENIKIASVLDIACMKITAISSRGSKKDFYDLWIILQHCSLIEIIEALKQKYEGVNYSMSHIFKSLLYFDDAELDPEPVLLVDTNWEKVKRDITKKVEKEYIEKAM